MAIDIGPGASKLGLSIVGNYTCFNVENPANADGIITVMECYFTIAKTSVKMGTFYGSDSSWTNRDYESLGNCAGGSVTTFTGLNCECKAGDQIGLYSAYYLAMRFSGQGYYRNSGDTFAAGEKSYTPVSDSTVALYATGISAAAVTTNTPTSIAATSLTANGNITATGGSGSDVTRRGFCYMEGTSGDPDANGTTLYSAEVVGSTANPSVAAKAFTAVNCTGLTKANGVLKIDLKCDAPEKLSGTLGRQIELTSSGKSDVNEWWMYPPLSEITTSYKTFYLPLSNAGTYGGELDVSAINFIRIYAYSTDSGNITLSWRNAAILKGIAGVVYDDGTFGTGAYTKSITGLSSSTNYRIRAFAVNITGTSYGATVQAKTFPENSFLPGHKFIPAFIGGII